MCAHFFYQISVNASEIIGVDRRGRGLNKYRIFCCWRKIEENTYENIFEANVNMKYKINTRIRNSD